MPDTSDNPPLSPVEFLSRAQTTKGLDKWIDEQLATPDVTERSMLRVMVFLLHSIGSIPWNEQDGLDALRKDVRSGEILPTWRECIGATLGVSYAPVDSSDAEEDVDG